MGKYQDIHLFNRKNTKNYNSKLLSFVRWSKNEKLLIITNFDAINTYKFTLKLSPEVIEKWSLQDGEYQLKDELFQTTTFNLKVNQSKGLVPLEIKPLESFILKLQ
jgi:hypothetical protein